MGKFDQLRAIKIIQYSVQWSTLNWSKYYNLFGFDHESKTILMIDFDWIINNEYKFQSNFDPVLETEKKCIKSIPYPDLRKLVQCIIYKSFKTCILLLLLKKSKNHCYHHYYRSQINQLLLSNWQRQFNVLPWIAKG